MNVTEFPDLALAREEAAGWVARLDRGLTAQEAADLRKWCAGRPANARALRQMSGLWSELNAMKALAEVFPEGLEQIEAAGVTAPAVATADTGHSHASAPRRRVRPALAASLIVALVGAGAATWLIQRGNAPAASMLARAAEATFTTAVGEQRDHALADGSTLAINTGSLVEVLRLDAGMRELRLQRGEALFSVAHDPARPFRVVVGGHIVEAVGTEFDVRLHEGGAIDVVVTEGRVRLLSGDAVTGMLDRGEAMRIGADGSAQVTQLDAHALAARLAWRRGMIEFRGQPLAEALTEFSRYTPVQFVITDPAAARLPIGGSVLAGDVDMLLEALHTNFGLESSRGPDGSIRIARKR